MNRNRNIRKIKESCRNAEGLFSPYSDGSNSRGMTFAEFARHLEERDAIQNLAEKSFTDIARTVFGIGSLGIFKHLIG